MTDLQDTHRHREGGQGTVFLNLATLDTILEHTVRDFQSTDVVWRLDSRKYFFSNRVVRHWNGLKQQIVDAQSVNAFKNRLDRHWKDMGI